MPETVSRILLHEDLDPSLTGSRMFDNAAMIVGEAHEAFDILLKLGEFARVVARTAEPTELVANLSLSDLAARLTYCGRRSSNTHLRNVLARTGTTLEAVVEHYGLAREVNHSLIRMAFGRLQRAGEAIFNENRHNLFRDDVRLTRSTESELTLVRVAACFDWKPGERLVISRGPIRFSIANSAHLPPLVLAAKAATFAEVLSSTK